MLEITRDQRVQYVRAIRIALEPRLPSTLKLKKLHDFGFDVRGPGWSEEYSGFYAPQSEQFPCLVVLRSAKYALPRALTGSRPRTGRRRPSPRIA